MRQWDQKNQTASVSFLFEATGVCLVGRGTAERGEEVSLLAMVTVGLVRCEVRILKNF